MNQELLIIVGYLLVIVVFLALPMWIATVIHKKFPNEKITASGPLAGLTISAGGAIATYLVILAVEIVFLYPPIGKWIDRLGASPTWVLEGRLQFQDLEGRPLDYPDWKEDLTVLMDPRTVTTTGNRLTLRMPGDQQDWSKHYVYLQLEGFGGADIDLFSLKRENKIEEKDYTLTLVEPIVVTRTLQRGSHPPVPAGSPAPPTEDQTKASVVLPSSEAFPSMVRLEEISDEELGNIQVREER